MSSIGISISIGANHQPGIGIVISMNVQSGIGMGIGMVVLVEHWIQSHTYTHEAQAQKMCMSMHTFIPFVPLDVPGSLEPRHSN